jgi:hypothetical protein
MHNFMVFEAWGQTGLHGKYGAWFYAGVVIDGHELQMVETLGLRWLRIEAAQELWLIWTIILTAKVSGHESVGETFGWRRQHGLDENSVKSAGEGSITGMGCVSEVNNECRSSASLPRKASILMPWRFRRVWKVSTWGQSAYKSLHSSIAWKEKPGWGD